MAHCTPTIWKTSSHVFSVHSVHSWSWRILCMLYFSSLDLDHCADAHLDVDLGLRMCSSQISTAHYCATLMLLPQSACPGS